MIVECHLCEAKVDANLIGQHTSCDEDDPAEFHSFLLECPKCRTTLLGGRYDFEAEPLTRLWPVPEKYISHEIPEIIRKSLEEARICFKGGAYNATTVMAGRALEGLCRHFGTEKTYLGPGIRELYKRGLIDARLARWAGALQKARNLSAHASGERVSKQDAEDLLDFMSAICEYIFVLTKKFEDYMARKGEPTEVSTRNDEDENL
jgi:HEPN domain-containing protein